MTQNSGEHRPLLVQAPVRALDPDGLAVVTSGTAAFALGAIVCWLWQADLLATGRLWYLYVAITGTVFGLIGIGVGLIRRRGRGEVGAARSVEQAEVDADGVPDGH